MAAANNRSAPTTSKQPTLTTEDALVYLSAVKQECEGDNEKYNKFLEVMKDFRARRVDTPGAVMRVKDLFNGNRKLILGFNKFLPKEYQLIPPPEMEVNKPAAVEDIQEFQDAIIYVNKIKARFETDEHAYKTFLEILNVYRKGNKTTSEVYQEISLLFKHHQDLLDEFTYFLPRTSKVPASSSAKPVPMTRQRAKELSPAEAETLSALNRFIEDVNALKIG